MAKLNINGFEFEVEFSLVSYGDEILFEVFINNEVLPTYKNKDAFQEDLNQLKKLILEELDSIKIQVGIFEADYYGEIIFTADEKDIRVDIYACVDFDENEVETSHNYATINYTSFITRERLLNFYTDLKNEVN